MSVHPEHQSDIELVDYPDDEDQFLSEATTTQQPSEPQVRRNPTRDRHPPQRYSDYVQQ